MSRVAIVRFEDDVLFPRLVVSLDVVLLKKKNIFFVIVPSRSEHKHYRVAGEMPEPRAERYLA